MAGKIKIRSSPSHPITTAPPLNQAVHKPPASAERDGGFVCVDHGWECVNGLFYRLAGLGCLKGVGVGYEAGDAERGTGRG